MTRSDSGPAEWWLEPAIALLALVVASLSIYLTRLPDGIALFWPTCAVAGALLIRLRRARFGRAALLLLAAYFLSNHWIAHRSLYGSALLAAVNLFETGLMVAVFRRVRIYPYPNISIGHAASMTLIFGLLIPAISALVGAAAMQFLYASAYRSMVLQWWGAHAIGACLVSPPIILFSRRGMRRLVKPPFLWENLLTGAICVGTTYLLIRYVRFPFVTISLLLLVSAFRLGGLGTALLSLMIGLLVTILWAFGIQPLGVDPALLSGTLINLPVLALLATVMPPVAVGIGSDARRATARALKASERHFREALAHSPVGMLVATLDGQWSSTNLALQQMLGYSDEEFRAMPPGGPSDPEDWRTSESRWSRLVSGEISVYDVDRRFRHKDGRWIWTHVAVSLLRDPEGAPQYLIAQIENLEARRQAEMMVAEERERLRITLQTLADAVITTDSDTRITFANPSAANLLGLDATAVLGRRVDEVIQLMDPVSLRSAESLIARCSLHLEPVRRERPCVLHRADGTLLHVRDTVSPVLDGWRQLAGLVILFQDATAEMDRTRALQERATFDALTGLVNRAEFSLRLTRTFDVVKNLEGSAVLLALDLDLFKAVNDSGGHAAGDAILRKVAEICEANVRSSDTVARLGGDEFAILMSKCSLERAMAIGERILKALNPLEIEWNGATYQVGASMGVAAVSSRMENEQQWLAAADAACYEAKRAGRGVIRIAA